MPIKDIQKLKKFFEERICVICDAPFYVKKKGTSRNFEGLRGRNTVTCSTPCSKKHKLESDNGKNKNGKQ